MSRMDKLRWPRATLSYWFRAWREVLRDPDKTIPEPAIPPEGNPIPEDMELHCLECEYSLTGLSEWRCPECGERFNPRLNHTIRMLREPEYFLRYRLGPEHVRRIFLAIAMLVSGAVLLCVANAILWSKVGGTVRAAMIASAYGMGWIFGLSIPSLILIKFTFDLPWARMGFYFSIIWFVGSAGVFIIVLL